MLLFTSWMNRKSGVLGGITFLAVLLFPSIPLRGLGVWLETLLGLFPTNIFYPILAFLIGSFVSLYVYNRKVKACCSVKDAQAGASASFAGILLGACPACIPALAFFLPLSITVSLSYFSWVFLLISIGILIFALYRMNGFKKK